MKKFLIIALVLCCFGCTTNTTNTTNTLENENSKATSFNAFNDESYVWESWIFSTNKVNNLK